MRHIALLLTLACGMLIGAAAMAGIGEDNIYVSLHRNPGDTEAVYELRLHRGDANIDTVSSEFGAADFHHLKAAAIASQSEFDTEAAAVLGSWYTGLSTARKAEFRSAFIDMC